jgi:two-component system heavy metal sensor histidine kinase CusS
MINPLRSLRTRLLLSTSLSMATVLGLLGLAIYFSVRRSLQAEFDRGLIAQARALAAMAEQNGQQVTFEFDPQQLPEFAAKSRPEYFEAWLDGSKVLTRSDSLGTHDLTTTQSTAIGVYENMILPNGHHGRSVSIAFTPRLEPGPPASISFHSAVIIVARETAVLHHTMETVRWLLLALFSAAIVVTGAVLFAVVGSTMKPVHRMARDIEALAETNLSNHLQIKDVPSELTPVVEKLNALFDRLSQAFVREKAFTADVAHELRTPLAGLQATLEVCRSRPRDALAYESAIDKCRTMTDRMQTMIETLLLLGRAEAGQLVPDRQTFDLCLLIQECWANAQHRAEARNLKLNWKLPDTCSIQTDREKLSIVIQNLLGNALAYCDDAGVVTISAGLIDSGAFVEIANTGSSVSAEEASHLFERFWRGDPSRSDTGSHYGLGLSLCQRLMNILNGQITIQTQAGGMFVARLWLP